MLKFLSIFVLLGALILGGCGNKSADGKKNDPALTTELETEGGSIESGEGYGFTIFDLEIDVDGNDAIDVSYDVRKKADADYENQLDDIDLDGAEAMDEIFLLFNQLRLTKDMPEDEVIDTILKFYGIDHYSKFELNVDFDEGTQLHINKTN